MIIVIDNVKFEVIISSEWNEQGNYRRRGRVCQMKQSEFNKSTALRAILVIALTLSLVPQIPVLAMPSCPMACSMMPNCVMTLDTLPDCLTMHWKNGDILSQGVYKSLLTEATLAIAARNHGQNGVAINMLNALIHEVNALRSKLIKDMAADCLVMHAEAAINSLQSGP